MIKSMLSGSRAGQQTQQCLKSATEARGTNVLDIVVSANYAGMGEHILILEKRDTPALKTVNILIYNPLDQEKSKKKRTIKHWMCEEKKEEEEEQN